MVIIYINISFTLLYTNKYVINTKNSILLSTLLLRQYKPEKQVKKVFFFFFYFYFCFIFLDILIFYFF